MTMTPTDPDLVDVLAEDGTVVATAPREEVRARNLRHRSVFVALVNGAGEVLVHRRADWKDLWPGAWDVAVGGVVEAGEAWELAAARELAEEVGVTAELQYLGEGCYADEQVQEVARVYLAHHDGPVEPRDGEVAEWEWVPLDRLAGWLADRTVCPDSRALVVPRLDAP